MSDRNNAEIIRRALKAETDAATLRALLDQAMVIIQHDYPLGGIATDGLQGCNVRNFIPRATQALEDTKVYDIREAHEKTNR